jgi:hypothetical protein
MPECVLYGAIERIRAVTEMVVARLVHGWSGKLTSNLPLMDQSC